MYGRMQYCSAGGCGGQEVDYAAMIAGWAKTEILREKVKARLEKKYSAQLDKVADLVVEVITQRAASEDAVESSESELQEAVEGLYDQEVEGD